MPAASRHIEHDIEHDKDNTRKFSIVDSFCTVGQAPGNGNSEQASNYNSLRGCAAITEPGRLVVNIVIKPVIYVSFALRYYLRLYLSYDCPFPQFPLSSDRAWSFEK